MNEEWKDLRGFEGVYQVSSLGRLRSLTRTSGTRRWQGRILKDHRNRKSGYHAIGLSTLIHRLVARTFLLNPEGKPCVNHKDGNKSNNAVSNLEWTTYGENEKHSYSVLGKVANDNGTCGREGLDNPKSQPVAEYSGGKLIRIYSSFNKAEQFLHAYDGMVKKYFYRNAGDRFRKITKPAYEKLHASGVQSI